MGVFLNILIVSVFLNILNFAYISEKQIVDHTKSCSEQKLYSRHDTTAVGYPTNAPVGMNL